MESMSFPQLSEREPSAREVKDVPQKSKPASLTVDDAV
jgi:hypothetical protein